MKKKFFCIVSLLMMLSLIGCSNSSSKSFTYSLDNNDCVVLHLDTSDGYDISSNIPFEITLNDETVSQGAFVEAEVYEEYAEVVEQDATILDSGTKDGNEYMFWNYDDSEWNYIIKIADSETAVLLGNTISEESAQEVFNRLRLVEN